MLIKRIHCSVCGNTLNATCIGIDDYEITDSSYEIMCHECFLSWEENDVLAHAATPVSSINNSHKSLRFSTERMSKFSHVSV